MTDKGSRSERTIVLLIGAVQLINVLDFVMVMPLGPDFAEGLNISTAHIGILGGSYTLAAALSGIVGSFFLDRFDRRKALACTLFGLVLGTGLGGFATGMWSLVSARILAGIFGGPSTSLAFAIVTDSVPAQRRGAALATIMMAFSIASVLGVPLALEVAQHFGWRGPFFCLAGLGLLVAGAAIFLLPPMRGHLEEERPSGHDKLLDEPALLSLLSIALVMLGVFAVVPSLSPYVQHNLGYSRRQLGLLYLVGGACSFVAMRWVGIFVDRFGATTLVVIGTLAHITALALAFLRPELGVPIVVFFILYMLSGSIRMVPLQTLATQVPSPARRARYMSTQSAVQHISSSIGAMGASWLLHSTSDGAIQGMTRIAVIASVLAGLVPFLVFRLQRRLRQRLRQQENSLALPIETGAA